MARKIRPKSKPLPKPVKHQTLRNEKDLKRAGKQVTSKLQKRVK